MAHFQFEADFVDSLRCIPMQVRFKLDTCGVKLKLAHWHRFSQAQRQALVELPCASNAEIQAYRQCLHDLIWQHTSSAATDLPLEVRPAWLDAEAVPESVQLQAEGLGVSLALRQWASLTPLQRFVLIKLSRSSHENRNFGPALQEFQLA